MNPPIFTIGHSNHSLADFLSLLAQHQIEALVDVRRFPGSRAFPHLNQPNLATAVRDAGIAYHWLEALGGRRSKGLGEASPNVGLRNDSFRNYADYMLTPAFRHGIDELFTIAKHQRTAIMCAEAVYWRCHRRLISDFLIAKQIEVLHIFPDGTVRPHALTEGAKVANGSVTYPSDGLFP